MTSMFQSLILLILEINASGVHRVGKATTPICYSMKRLILGTMGFIWTSSLIPMKWRDKLCNKTQNSWRTGSFMMKILSTLWIGSIWNLWMKGFSPLKALSQATKQELKKQWSTSTSMRIWSLGCQIKWKQEGKSMTLMRVTFFVPPKTLYDQ